MRFGFLGGALLAVLGVLLAIPPSVPGQTLSTYDDFSAAGINGGRWFGVLDAIRYANLVDIAGGWSNQAEGQWMHHPEFSIVNAAVRRQIVGGQLQLQLTTAGGTHPDPDVAPGHGRVGLRMHAAEPRNLGNPPPQPVTRIQTQVTVIEAQAQPCRSTGESRTRAQLFAHLFNDGSSPGSWDLTGDVFASLSLQRKSFEPDRIVAVVSRCRDVGCTVADDLGSVVFNRAWRLGATHMLTITHQAGNNRVSFQVTGGGVAAETRWVSYPRPASRSESARHSELRLENTPANCPADGGSPAERVEVTMDARFDNVRVNDAAVPAP